MSVWRELRRLRNQELADKVSLVIGELHRAGLTREIGRVTSVCRVALLFPVPCLSSAPGINTKTSRPATANIRKLLRVWLCLRPAF